MFTALENSLDPKFKSEHMLHDESEYTVQGTKIAALYLLRIFKKCEIGTLAMIAMIRSDLQNLDKLVLQCKSNIRIFNSKVKTMVQKKLRCYGEPVHNLIHSLFKAYDVVKDSEFVRTIRDERKAFILGNRPDLTADSLMDLAESLFNIYVEDKSWMQHINHEEQIVALQAEIKSLKAKSSSNNRTNSSRGKGGKGNASRNRRSNNKSEKCDDDDNSEKKWSWKTKAPSSKESKERVHEGKTYYWCKNHRQGNGLWVLHKPVDCRNASNSKTNNEKRGDKDRDSSSSSSESSDYGKTEPKASVTAALALLEEEDSSSQN